MRVIGLTGGIACGKSNVSMALAKKGVPVVDADAVSHALTAPGGAGLPEIQKTFGDSVFHEDGTLNRASLGALVFQNEEARKKLNNILHPMIEKEIAAKLEQFRQSGAKCCILEVPLLFEAGMNRLCDTVWCVTLPYKMQLQRLMKRDGLNRKQAKERIHSQMPGWLRALRSDHRISSTGTREETQRKALHLFERTEEIRT